MASATNYTQTTEREQKMIEIFDKSDLIVFGVLFLVGVPYAIALELWQRRFPQSFDALTWFQVVVGVGYVLLGLIFILPLEMWLRVSAAFFFACIPIITRSVSVHSLNQRDAEEIETE